LNSHQEDFVDSLTLLPDQVRLEENFRSPESGCPNLNARGRKRICRFALSNNSNKTNARRSSPEQIPNKNAFVEFKFVYC